MVGDVVETRITCRSGETYYSTVYQTLIPRLVLLTAEIGRFEKCKSHHREKLTQFLAWKGRHDCDTETSTSLAVPKHACDLADKAAEEQPDKPRSIIPKTERG